MTGEGIVASVAGEVKKIEGAVVTEVQKVETVARAEFNKLKADFEALLARIENHNSKGGAI